MPGLGNTVADLLARAGAPSPTGATRDLTAVADFGANPGGLKMRLHTPDRLPPGSPLVVVLHGCGQTASGYAAGAGWLQLADQEGFAVLCPEQTRANNANLCFNWFEDGDTRRGGGEAASIAQMVRWAVAHLDGDPRRVFVTGLSAGGAMAAALLATYPELFAAGAIIAGLPYGCASGVGQAMSAMRRIPDLSARAWGDKVRGASAAPVQWPRVSIWLGEADTTVTPAAGHALALQWCDVNGCRAHAQEEVTTHPGHMHTTWRDTDGLVAVELHRVAGLGHGTPIAADGVSSCGEPGPWIIDAGVSSSHRILLSWGIDHPQASAAAAAATPEAPRSPAGIRTAAPSEGKVADIISRALRQAGLMR